MKRAYTLLELTITIIIVGILAGLALPRFSKIIESTKAKEAVVALEQIRAAERVYRMEENTYWPVGSTETDVNKINSKLNLFLDTREINWSYSVIATADSFTARAIRTSGSNKDEKIVIDESGIIDMSTWSP